MAIRFFFFSSYFFINMQRPQEPELPPLPRPSEEIAYAVFNLEHLAVLNVDQQRYVLCSYLDAHPNEAHLWARRARLEFDNSHPAVTMIIVTQGLQQVPDEPYLTAMLGT